MWKIIEKVIESKNFELSDMLKKIDTLWVHGKIDDDTRSILSNKARENANVQNSFDVIKKLEELDKRVKELEAKANPDTEEETEDPKESYEEYKVGKWYYAGNRVMFEGKVYECIAPENATCVWSPTEYPAYWEEIV